MNGAYFPKSNFMYCRLRSTVGAHKYDLLIYLMYLYFFVTIYIKEFLNVISLSTEKICA
jgi:hypothetical protein